MGGVGSPSITEWLIGPGIREAEGSPYIKPLGRADLVLFTNPLLR